MWTNSLLKKNAWETLKNYYWTALGVTFLGGILGAGRNFSLNFGSGGSSASNLESDLDSMNSTELFAFLMIMLVVILCVWAISIAMVSFLGNPVRVGMNKFFCSARNGDVNFGYLFANFKEGKYMPTVKTMFFMQLYIFLWGLLFWIPGIIKTYEYYLVPYLLAENPNLSKERAFEISKKTMDGEKMNVFILELSFIGWYLLGLCACCVGIYAVVPYFQATIAEFYMCMRAKMLSYGYTTEEELSGDFSGFNGFGGGFGGFGNPYDNNNNNPYDSYTGGSYNNGGYPNNNSYNGTQSYIPNHNNNMSNSGGYSGTTQSDKVSLDKPQNDFNGNMPGITHDAYGNPIDPNSSNSNNPYDNN